MFSMVTVFIDGVCINVLESMTILQACSLLKLDIPRFCYHEKLSIAGNCRMCLVEVNTSRKLVVSCAMPVSENLCVQTNTLRVKKARESVLEFLLINHPLDCPICDQGGECDLQDLTMIFGSDRGRYYEVMKRAVVDKDFGVFIGAFMTRCIHCTRCIRFFVEVCGILDVGVVGRGSLMEIGTYVDHFFDHELLGNVIDLCPVGALTSKPFMFRARSWELVAIETVDILDGMCSNIRMDVVGTKVLRVLPSVNELINEE
jgi:NADH dehydrogenase/NADH:ubiquinone oxidoreductase subunit G